MLLLAPAAQAACAAMKPPPAFLDGLTQIRGVRINADISGTPAAPGGLTPARAETLRRAGFNTIRLNVDPSPALLDHGELDAIADDMLARIAAITAEGFRAYVQFSLPARAGPASRLRAQADPALWKRYVAVVSALVTRVASRHGPHAAAFDLMNEPFPDEAARARGGGVTWVEAAHQLWEAARAAAPPHTLMIQGVNPRSSLSVTALDPDRFDINTVFVFHAYDPGIWTHQGRDYPYLYGVPFPAADYPGGEAGALRDVAARIDADAALSPPERRRLRAEYAGRVRFLFRNQNGLSEDWIGKRWSELDGWIAAERLNPRRILIGEFGVVSKDNFPSLGQIPLSGEAAERFARSRAAFIGAVWRQQERRCFMGGVIHQLHGDFNIGRQNGVFSPGSGLLPIFAELFAELWGAPAR